MLAGRRQSSLDETGGGGRRGRLRRQASGAPPPILAWQESISEQDEKQKQVEVVAKKIGQPKPTAPTRALRSPSVRNPETCLTISRRQVAERLRVGWSKANVKEGQDKGRQNLNIFLNKSLDTRPASPKTPELGNSGYRRSQSFIEDRQDGLVSISGSTSDSESSSEDETVEVTMPTGGPRQSVTPTPAVRGGQSPQQARVTPSPKPPLSASARRAAFRAVGRQRPTSGSPEPPRPRLMSAPPQAARPAADRPTSAPPRRPRRTSAKPRRGVEGGEVVTMVSLVSPAESEDEDLPPVTVQCPPTPEIPPTPEPTLNTPPPPVLSLRRPPKAVTFKSCSVDGAEYRTSYPALVRSATILQEERTSGRREEAAGGGERSKRQPQVQKTGLVGGQQARTVRARNRPPARDMKRSQNQIPEPIQEEVVKTEEEEEEKAVVRDEKKKTAEEVGEEEGKTEDKDPDLRSAKERECWQLFKRMSSRGVSVSFETVLRGLLTPTEYRLRRSALLASC